MIKSSVLYKLILLLLLAGISGCRRKELPVPAHNPGNVVTNIVELDPTYKWQVYFNLKKNTVVGRNLKTAWDIGLEATASGYHVILNSSKSMFAFNTGKKEFASISLADTAGFASNRKWDTPNGNMDSTATGDWRTTGSVYVIDRGYNELGVHMGFSKVQFLSVDDSTYAVCFAKIKETSGTVVKVRKDSSYNFMFLSLDGGELVSAEPPKKDWDLALTQYTHVFYDPFTTYLVTGCLLNRYHTTAYMDSSTGFEQIVYGNIKSAELSPDINTIGYDWKTYTGSKYVTNSRLVYIIKDAGGVYYKLHFTDFYSTGGIKGNPKWEYQQL